MRKRRTRGKGRKINYQPKPRNLGKLLEEVIKHLSSVHDCDRCEQIVEDVKVNLLSPFGIRCYSCEEPVSDNMLHVSNEGRMYCQKCSTMSTPDIGVLDV